MNKVFLQKDDQRLPDYFGMIINYITGKSETLKVASRVLIPNTNLMELVLFEDKYKLVILDNVLSIDYDENYTKFIEIAKKNEKKKQEDK